MTRLNKKQFGIKLAKLIVIGFVVWLNPQASLLILILEFCFESVELIQDQD